MAKKYFSDLFYSIIIAAEVCITFLLTVHIKEPMYEVFILAFMAFMLAVTVDFICTILTSFNFKKRLCFVIALPVFIAAVIGGTIIAGNECSASGLDDGKENIFSGKNVMIIVPHQDDEILLCGGVIENYVSYGSNVTVVFTTNGDYDGEGEKRLEEALNVMEHLGIDDSHVVFLGYGDQWQFKHIYNRKDDEITVSHIGNTATYGLKEHPAYNNGAEYTRRNYKNNLKSLICNKKPDVIYCIDCDEHSDHISTSLIFEECLGEILKSDNTYRPKVYKGFAYSTGGLAADDYSAYNNKSTQNPYNVGYMKENNVYMWDNRIRIPVSSATFSSRVENEKVYKTLDLYASQGAAWFASKSINGDKVFWERNTNSALYDAKVTSTSGKADCLNDFKLCDYSNVYDFSSFSDGTGVWTASENDKEKSVEFVLNHETELSGIKLYDNPSLNDNILNAFVIINDNYTIETGKLNANGSETEFDFPKVEAKKIKIVIDKYEGEKAGLTEVEAFTENNDNSGSFVKIVNSENDFVYAYNMTGVTEEFGISAYEISPELYSGFAVECDNKKCSAELKNGKIIIKCPMNEKCNVTLKGKDFSDTVLIMGSKANTSYYFSLKVKAWYDNIFSFDAQKRYMKKLILP